jgi:ABC-type transport system substrate-binding protein
MSHTRRDRVSRRTLLKGAVAVAPVAPGGFTASRAFAAQGGEPVRGGTLTYGNAKPPQNIINPMNTIGTGQNVLIEALFLRLVYGRQWGDGINPDPNSSEVELAVAETMTEIEPNRVWEFTLRQNVLWHDGQPVTADDVIFGIWWALNADAKPSSGFPPAGIKGAAALQAGGGATTPPYDVAVEGATKLGDYAVRIELEKATPNYWVNWGIGYWPMPKHIFGEMPIDHLYA